MERPNAPIAAFLIVLILASGPVGKDGFKAGGYDQRRPEKFPAGLCPRRTELSIANCTSSL
jgi:hypothetical protein